MKKASVHVDASNTLGVFPRTWQYIGYDECNSTLTPTGKDLLRAFGALSRGGPADRANPKHYYVRAHHMLCTGNLQALSKWGSTNVYLEDESGNPVHDFSVIDQMLDVWLGNGLKPFFEIGFMPRDLADPRFIEHGTEYSLSPLGDYRRSGYAAPPKDYGRWYDLVHALVAHCVERYGPDEVDTWYWELWNEPDIMYWKGTHEEFCHLYDVTEAAVHDALPSAYFGGPATTGTDLPDGEAAVYLDRFLEHVRTGNNFHSGKTGTRIDYISFHTKGGIYNTNLRKTKQLPTVDLFIANVKIGCDIIKKHGLEGLEIVLSEADPDSWAAGGRYDNFNLNFRNTEYFASYIACTYERLYALADEYGMDIRPLAWTFAFDWERLFEGLRSFSTQGVTKASFNLFRLYRLLGGTRLAASVDTTRNETGVWHGAWAFQADDGGTQVMLYRHHDDWDVHENGGITVHVDGLSFDGPVVVERVRIDATHSNPYSEWLRQGKPEWASEEQYRAIRDRSGLECATPVQGTVSGGSLTIETELGAHALELLTVRQA